MRFTKIVATVGPATSAPENLAKMLAMGVNVARLNFSHGDHAYHGASIDTIRKLNSGSPHKMAVMLDTKGPEIRTGDVEKPLEIRKGDKVIFSSKPLPEETMPVIVVNYDKFPHDVKQAKTILIDNGTMEMSVLKIKHDRVIARALEGGKIGSRRHVNIPGAHISLPSFTDKDWDDIRFGISKDVDFIAPSFVRGAEDIRQLKRFIRKHKGTCEVMAKIETLQAVQDIANIIDEADSIMVARGDLGAEVPFEDVPRIQNDLIQRCRAVGKPVLVATQMLESMITNPFPTRAEVTDITHAAMAQADATMLSGETAAGMYPFKALDAMIRILEANEKIDMIQTSFAGPLRADDNDFDLCRREQAIAASILARNLDADALLIFSRHGWTAKYVSNCRPPLPILAFTESESVQRKLQLSWGVIPRTIPFSHDPEKTVAAALAVVRKEGLLKKGQRIVVVSDILTGRKPVMTVQIREVA